MPLDWAPFVDLVRRHRRFLLTTHVRPDPDGLGSMLALADVLEGLGKEVQLVIASLYPPRYEFMDPRRRVRRFEAPLAHSLGTVDAVVILDTGTWNQLGDLGPFLRQLPVPKAVLDHHPTQDDLGATRFVDTTAEATGRLVWEVARALSAPVPPETAQQLFLALATDTGWFRHPNTTPATFALAGELVALGARPTEGFDQIYEQNTAARLKLIGVALGRLQVGHGGRVAWMEVRRDDYAATGAIPQDTEEFINYPRSIRGVEVGLLFLEQPRGGIKVSFRARALDVGRVAEGFGGGGHRLAAGATLETSLDDARARVLAAVFAALDALP
jgi:phosphoesterase RecJ-like protein